MPAGAYHFAAWTRSGIGALLDGSQRSVTLALGDAGDVPVALGVHTPGDVIGLDPRAIIRTVPAPGATDHPPNLFATVELEHPALPWLVSPTGAGDHVVPWIALVVVRDQLGVALTTQAATRRTILTIDPPARCADELPDLSQAWAWAHAQTIGAAFDPAALARSAGESRARLIAPRALAPRTAYAACIVPVFAGGVAAALGTDAADPAAPAWAGTESAVTLPVLFAWRFTTGDGGDFASLARAIQPTRLAADVGGRMIDLADPGWGAPAQPGAQIAVGGALRSENWIEPPVTAAAIALGDAIVAAIDAPPPPPGLAPVFPPPAHGSAASRAERIAAAPPWQRALNGSPGQRIAAGLGAAVVRAHQDELVEAAWREAGDAEAANALIRRCELAAELTRRLAQRHIAPLASDGEVLSIARPLLARMALPVATGGGPTVAAAIRASALPDAVLLPALRRVARSPAVARFTPAATGVVLEKLDTGAIVAAPPIVLAAGAVAFDRVDTAPDRPRLATLTPDAIDAAAATWRAVSVRPPPVGPRPPLHPAVVRELARARDTIPAGEGPLRPPPLDDDTVLDPGTIDELAAAARRHQAYLLGLTLLPRLPPRFGTAGARPLAAVRAAIEAQWSPQAGILPLLASRFEAGDPRPGFDPVVVMPVLERPLLPLLHQLSPEHVMPGISGLVRDRAALAVSGPEFVRALLVGANEELGRELLWRGFPGALGHSWLRTFWGRNLVGADGVRVADPDIPPIETWPPDGPPAKPAELVLIIRAELFARYPNAVVYAAPARWVGTRRNLDPDAAPTLPVIASRLGGDLVLYGFDLSPDRVRGGAGPPADPGWYFVIAEHPSEPTFGLAARSFGPVSRWRDLAWSDLAPEDLRGSYLRTDGPLAQRTLTGPPATRWGLDASTLAAISLRVPTRVAFHATTLLA